MEEGSNYEIPRGLIRGAGAAAQAKLAAQGDVRREPRIVAQVSQLSALAERTLAHVRECHEAMNRVVLEPQPPSAGQEQGPVNRPMPTLEHRLGDLLGTLAAIEAGMQTLRERLNGAV